MKKKQYRKKYQNKIKDFFVLVFILSVPLWIVGEFIQYPWLLGLPISSLMTFCPFLATCIVCYRSGKMRGIIEFLLLTKKKVNTNILWYVVSFLLMPGIFSLSYVIMWMLPYTFPDHTLALQNVLVLFPIFFIAALGEEMGWTGYILNYLLARWNKLQSSLILGLIWAVWHSFPYLQMQHAWEWIGWQSIFLISSRYILIWMYTQCKQNILPIIICHAMINCSWQLFPVGGSCYDPKITGLIALIIAVLLYSWENGNTKHHPIQKNNDSM